MTLRSFIGNLGLPELNRAQGVDVYGRYQGYFRPETATQRIDFAIQKLTEGITIVDAKREEIWAGVKQIGMRGAYHYQRSDVSWLAQANYFLEYASMYDHHFIALDVETIGNRLDNAFAADMFRIINHWKDQVGSEKKVVLYSNKDLLQNFIFPKIQLLFGSSGVKWLVEEVDIWYAQYFFLPSVNKQPVLPAWMKTWKLWQITPSAFKGPEFGVQSQEVDVNVFNGTADDMRAWLGLAPEPTEPPTEPPVVVEPPERPEITPEPRLWNAEVLPLRRMIVRTYPLVANDTILKEADGLSPIYAYGGEAFTGRIWSGNDYLWIRVESSARTGLIGQWVAVRRSDGLEKFIKLSTPSNVPEGEGYWVALHDWQIPPDYKLREINWWMNGTPEVFRAGEFENSSNIFEVKMTEERQFWWFDLCSLHVFGRVHQDLTKEEYAWLAQRWTALGGNTLAFMNKHGLDTFHNYVLGVRKDMPEPVLYTIICGGMSAGGTVVKNSKGIEMVRLDYIDVTKPLPDVRSIDLKTDTRIFMATNISRKRIGDGYNVFRFTKFSEPAKGIYRDCPIPLMSTDPVYYPKSRMKWVAGTVKPSPYFP